MAQHGKSPILTPNSITFPPAMRRGLCWNILGAPGRGSANQALGLGAALNLAWPRAAACRPFLLRQIDRAGGTQGRGPLHDKRAPAMAAAATGARPDVTRHGSPDIGDNDAPCSPGLMMVMQWRSQD
jgi:hypothetical protein